MKQLIISIASVLLISVTTTVPISAAMLDSYSCKVVDGETGLPLKGATVVVSWGKTTPTPAGAVSGFIEADMDETGEDGTYRIAGRTVSIDLFSHVDGITFLVYQPGYTGFSKTYYDGTHVAETRLIKLQQLRRLPDDRQSSDDFEHGIFRINPYIDESDTTLTPRMRFETLLKGVPEREVLRARIDWENLFRRGE